MSEDSQVVLSIVLGLLITVVALTITLRRLGVLTRLIRSGQPAVGRTDQPERRIQAELVEVAGQKKLLKWTVPGTAHFFAMWGFIVLGLTIIEAYGALFNRSFAIPVLQNWAWVAFIEDFFTVAVILALVVFALIRVKSNPKTQGRASRFYGSHTGAAWLVLFMIFNVLVDAAALPRRADQHRQLPVPRPVGVRLAVGRQRAARARLRPTSGSRPIGLLLNIGVILGFLVLVVYSKHLHIFMAPINVAFSRRPNALGPLLPMYVDGKPLDFENLDELDEDAVMGRGKVEDFTWKGLLDFATCTECGRCQSQCPAWNTGKPLSPKLLIMGLRDHTFAQAPYLTASDPNAVLAQTGYGKREAANPREAIDLESLPESVRHEIERPLVGPSVFDDHGIAVDGGVIDPDVLWSCTTCGACVEQCPVDIEHIDHIVDMRRYQVLVESAVPRRAQRPVQEHGEQGQPVGPERLAAAWTGPATSTSRCRVVDGRDPRRRRVALLGRLRRRVRGPREEDHAGRGRAAAPRGRRVRRAGRGRDLHRRLRAPRRATSSSSRCSAMQNVETLNDRRREEDRRDLRALLQHAGQRVPAARRQLARCCTTRSCSTAWCARAS